MEIYLVFVDAIQNSNKFWAAIVEDGNLTVQWGRVGYQAQTKIHTLELKLGKLLKILPNALPGCRLKSMAICILRYRLILNLGLRE
jgi:hypothetical protein